MYLERLLPKYLQADMSVSSFRIEARRQANEYDSKKDNSVVTRCGGVVIQKKKE